eukprot:385243-Rhodomonas_salina.2
MSAHCRWSDTRSHGGLYVSVCVWLCVCGCVCVRVSVCPCGQLEQAKGEVRRLEQRVEELQEAAAEGRGDEAQAELKLEVPALAPPPDIAC